MTIELDDETAGLLSQLMEQSQVDAFAHIKQALTCYLSSKQIYQTEQPELITDIIATLPCLPTFAGYPLETQKERPHDNP